MLDAMSAVPATLVREANALREAGRLAEAEAAYLLILGRWPSLPDCWFNLGVVQRRSGRFEAALASYQEALMRGISGPEEVHLNRAVIYCDCLRQSEAAERELREALRLNASYVPALLNLANLHEDRGQREEARLLYERALTLVAGGGPLRPRRAGAGDRAADRGPDAYARRARADGSSQASADLRVRHVPLRLDARRAAHRRTPGCRGRRGARAAAGDDRARAAAVSRIPGGGAGSEADA